MSAVEDAHSPALLVISSATSKNGHTWPAKAPIQKPSHLCHQTCKEKKCERERAWSIAKGEHFMLPCTTYQDADKKVDGPKKEALSTPGRGKEVVC